MAVIHIGLLNEVVDFAINLVNEVLSLVTHYEVCPVIRSLPESLDADNVKNRISILGQLKTAEENPEKTEETKNLLKQLISGIFEEVERLTGLKISNLHILDITFKETSDGKGAIVKVPITAEVNVNLPMLGDIVNLALNLDLQYSVSVETDEETKVSTVVVEECRSDQYSISLSVLGRRIKLFDEMLDFVINLVNEVLFLVTHYEVCPRVRSFLGSLDVDYVKNRIDELYENQQKK
nr:short palate, lung and nasal epithelium carcinoma-associated protein 2B-like [Odocoileus virginianus texanus]